MYEKQLKCPTYTLLGALEELEDVQAFKFLEQTPLEVVELYCEQYFKNAYKKGLYIDNINNISNNVWYHVGDSYYNKYAAVFLYLFEEPTDNSSNELNNKKETANVSSNIKPNSKGVSTMANNVNESFKTVMSMKMLNSIMKDKDQDLGKLFLMQQLMNGEPLQITDVIKSKLIKQFDLSDNDDLPLEKVMLLQMLDGGQVDMNQLIMFKMMGTLFDEDKESNGPEKQV